MLKKGFSVLVQRAEEGRPLIRSEFQTQRVSHRDRPRVLAAAGGGEPVCSASGPRRRFCAALLAEKILTRRPSARASLSRVAAEKDREKRRRWRALTRRRGPRLPA